MFLYLHKVTPVADGGVWTTTPVSRYRGGYLGAERGGVFFEMSMEEQVNSMEEQVMSMESQVTSIEQSQRLLELGVPAQEASMVWIYEDLYIASKVDFEAMRKAKYEPIPAFTVADLLGMLPVVIEIEGKRCVLSLKKIGNEYGVEYDCPYDDFGVSFIFFDTPLKAIYYAIEWIKRNWNKRKTNKSI